MKTRILKIIIIVLFLNSCGQISHQKFDANKWQNANLNLEENWDLRWRMMNDLRNNFDLEEKNKTEILKLLGKPDAETNDNYLYNLGMTGTGINTGNLTIFFDQNNNVREIKVRQG